MKAMLCKESGPIESLVLEDFELPPLGEGEVRVRVRSAGVNFPDILITQGIYQFKPAHPFSPGSECAGDVLSVGPGVTDFKAGDRVIAMTGHGAFAEEVNTLASNCLHICHCRFQLLTISQGLSDAHIQRNLGDARDFHYIIEP